MYNDPVVAEASNILAISMGISGNKCIMLFEWEYCNLLLLGTKDNANL